MLEGEIWISNVNIPASAAEDEDEWIGDLLQTLHGV